MATKKIGPRISSSDPLVSFLYILMRDKMPPGEVEALMADHVEGHKGETANFSNGWLAKHAKNLALRLRL